jgi:hypothetical protein
LALEVVAWRGKGLVSFLSIWVRSSLCMPVTLAVPYLPTSTTRKLINTNGHTEGIFSSVNFRGILPTEIFPRCLPRELPWEKIKTKQKKMMTCHFYQRNYQQRISSVKSIGKFVGKLWTLFIMSIIKGIIDEIFRRYFSESSKTVHFLTAVLIVVLYG